MKPKVNTSKTKNAGSFRAILKQELKKFTTKEDLLPLKSDVSTLKSDVSGLKSDVSTLKSDMFNFKLEIFEQVTQIELKAIDREQIYHSDVMTQFDKIMKKLETMREEITVGDFQTREKLEDHENRIKILESV